MEKEDYKGASTRTLARQDEMKESMLSSSLDALLKLSKTTSSQKLFLFDCITLYNIKMQLIRHLATCDLEPWLDQMIWKKVCETFGPYVSQFESSDYTDDCAGTYSAFKHRINSNLRQCSYSKSPYNSNLRQCSYSKSPYKL